MNVLDFDAGGVRSLGGAERLAFGRIAVGAGLVVAPGLLLRPWIGADAASPGTRLLARAMGGRDIALGIGLLLAARHEAPVRGWLEAGILADATDAAAALVALRRLPKGRAVLMALAGVGGALAGRRLVSSLP